MASQSRLSLDSSRGLQIPPQQFKQQDKTAEDCIRLVRIFVVNLHDSCIGFFRGCCTVRPRRLIQAFQESRALDTRKVSKGMFFNPCSVCWWIERLALAESASCWAMVPFLFLSRNTRYAPKLTEGGHFSCLHSACNSGDLRQGRTASIPTRLLNLRSPSCPYLLLGNEWKCAHNGSADLVWSRIGWERAAQSSLPTTWTLPCENSLGLCTCRGLTIPLAEDYRLRPREEIIIGYLQQEVLEQSVSGLKSRVATCCGAVGAGTL